MHITDAVEYDTLTVALHGNACEFLALQFFNISGSIYECDALDSIETEMSAVSADYSLQPALVHYLTPQSEFTDWLSYSLTTSYENCTCLSLLISCVTHVIRSFSIIPTINNSRRP